MRLLISNAARKDLFAIYNYTRQTYGKVNAINYLNKLDNAMNLIVTFPKIAKLRSEIIPPVRILPIEEHLLIYRELELDTIELLRVRHKREDW
ncbi:toxin ParE1/3/4 [Idiomarinaceae bacterium HL-53]|nr:toxin ParE1/3/4 [Idiomarinaceae bacterium HL-53]